MTFPQIDPVIFSIGPLAVRWYGMMYLLGFVGGYLMMNHVARLREYPLGKEQVSDLLFYGVIGVVAGGRIGYTLFYNSSYYLQHPLEIFYVWEGGMSFHGGLLGVLAVLFYYCWKKRYSLLMIADLVVAAVPIGLGFGRIGNFINAELWGRETDLPWGVIFPAAGPQPRHPSQLYEAALEGLVLLVVIYLLHRLKARPGVAGFSFLALYGLFRFLAEFVRQPDAHLGFLWGGATMGQLLSLPMLLIGSAGIVYCLKRAQHESD
ncbi:phosphatidylglycerol:prolipoprotein diacylglycerol transferase [Malonomonas rubra DSM 5091]|uniref:Phosphatidylglycerol--prolipoprotein diacylglyceryl transferase n=1 Tax=Malonomonas rubra DSM 5091 TaxID=1122189 RepID=A0A1M6CBX7_MALRU|nr:prolipoprotein diacylglyceryl transferase [Malonomonas rubra]SHI58228.1 phosphatidylglycerol:prolipoprotein diacylglycerol transferase [Malonomonas rubra DSM 5091]